MNPQILGITGGIGSGKSCVSRLLSSYCLAPLIDVDQCCRHLLDIDQPGWLALHAAFDEAFLLPNGAIDRVALRQRIFHDSDLRQQVNALLHPLVREEMRKKIARQSGALVLVEIPLLYEACWQEEVDAVLVVYARPAVRCCRIMHRDGISRKEAVHAMAAQLSLTEKAEHAHYVIDNSGDWIFTRSQVVALEKVLAERLQLAPPVKPVA